jgi:hypothetical protein
VRSATLDVMSVYILEIRDVFLRRGVAIGYGVDEHGREFAVALDPDLATDIDSALRGGRRPIVAVEKPLDQSGFADRIVEHVVGRGGTPGMLAFP